MPKKKYRTTREYLDIAAKIVTGQRQYDYGDKYQNHKNISELIDMAGYAAIAGEIHEQEDDADSPFSTAE